MCFLCVEGAIDAASRGTPKLKVLRKMNSKMVVVMFGPSLNLHCRCRYLIPSSFRSLFMKGEMNTPNLAIETGRKWGVKN